MSRVLHGGCICRHEPSSPAPGKEAAPGWLWVRVLLAYQTQGQGTQGHQKMGQQPIQPPHAFTEALKPSPSSLNRDSCSPMSPTTRTDGGFLPNCCDQFFFFFSPQFLLHPNNSFPVFISTQLSTSGTRASHRTWIKNATEEFKP